MKRAWSRHTGTCCEQLEVGVDLFDALKLLHCEYACIQRSTNMNELVTVRNGGELLSSLVFLAKKQHENAIQSLKKRSTTVILMRNSRKNQPMTVY
jgi:hypothetical protein